MTKVNGLRLGEKFTDPLTGFSGTLTGHCRHLTSVDQWEITPHECENGVPVGAQWFDEERLTQVTAERKQTGFRCA